MDKSVVNTFTAYVEQLRNTECSQKEKVACFQHIAECIISPALAAHINYATHINMATTVLLLFCEDLDSVVRMSAEENLNKIFRALEKTRVSRILMDLYGEIKRNGNQRSLRICLNLFAYYAPQIREKNIKWYAIRILPCLQTIAQRKETQLSETLCEFVKSFGKYLQMGLTDSEICKLFEVFLANIGAECAVKRRCSAQNCISLIENSRNKSLMAKHGLNKAIELLVSDQQNCTVLGVLGFLRLLLPLIIHGFRDDCSDDSDDEAPVASSGATTATAGKQQKRQRQQQQPAAAAVCSECRQIIEIYDYCLHLLSISNTSNHSTINAALEVVNAILQALDNNNNSNNGSNNNVIAKSLQQLLSNQQLQHAEYLRRRKSLKNQIFQLRNYEVAVAAAATSTATATAASAKAPQASDDLLLVSTARCQGATVTAVGGSGGGGESSTGSAKIISFGDKLASVHELRMQNVANAKMCQQKQHQQPESEARARAVTSVLGRGVGLAGTSVADEKKVAGAVADDVGLADNDDEAHVADATYKVRLAARSISECVVDDDAAASDLLAAAAHTDVEGDEDDDDFTTLSEINEPQQQRQRQPTTYTLTTTIDVDNLIDAIDAANIADGQTESSSHNSGNAATATPHAMAQKQPSGQQQQREDDASPQNLLMPSASAACTATVVGGGAGAGAGGGDDKSQHLSDIDNESFNSIDFESEITIAGIGGNAAGNTSATTTTTATTVATTAVAAAAAKTHVWGDERTGNAGAGDAGSKSSSDTIGSFFNNFISNAASESVSKLFRASAAVRSTPIKNAAQADTSVLVSPTSTPTSAAVDSLSMISNASSGNSNSKRDQHSSSAYMQSPSIASSSLGMHDDTPSTAVLADASLCATDALGSDEDTDAQPPASKEADVELRRIPNANPFLNENSPLKQSTPGLPLLTLNIGSVYEQPIVFYSARLIAARFLLSGQAQGLQNDSLIRISIKSLSLCALAHCVRLAPAVLQLPLEITEAELQLLAPQAADADSSPSSSASGSPCMPHSDSSSGSSNLGKDFEHLDERGDFVDFVKKSPFRPTSSSLIGGSDLPPDSLLLDIKDDHFGKSTCDYLLQSSELSKSADPVLLAQQVGGGAKAARAKHQKAFEALSKSDIIETHSRRQTATAAFEVTESAEDVPPQMLPPRPPKRTKSLRKSVASAATTVAALAQIDERARLAARTAAAAPPQQLSDILLYYNHADPMLRGGVQQIIGSFIQSTAAGLTLRLQLNLQHLLAMLLQGLQDDIHTVVIQALNAFDKIFPCVVSKYLIAPTACHQQLQQQQHEAVHKQAATSRELAAATGGSGDNAAGQAAVAPAQQLGPNDAEWAAHSPAKSSSAPMAPATSTTCPRTLFNDNDELIAALLNDFELQSKSKCGSDSSGDNTNEPTQTAAAAVGTFSISPKLLLNKLRLCHHNKYWLVQNKYAEVISNLNYVALRAHCCRNGTAGNASNHYCDNNDVNAALAADATAAPMENDDEQDIVCAYEAKFVDELLQLIGDDDFRVREHAAQCLCRFIIQNAKQQQREQQHTAAISNDSPTAVAAASSKCPPRHGDEDDSAAQSRSPSLTMATYETNFNLLWDFFDYRVFSGMSLPLRNLFRANSSIPPPLATTADAAAFASSSSSASSPLTSASASSSAAGAVLASLESAGSHGNLYAAATLQRRMAEEEKILAKVLYRMTNKLMALDDKNAQFGITYALRVLLQHFNFIDYQRAWMEFNFMEICMRFSYYNYATAVDLSCQNDLIDVTGKLMAGHFLVSASAACSRSEQQSPKQQQQQRQQSLQQQLDQLLTHIMKILNIYHHLCSNQKPLLFAKVQKTDLFANARELALVQSVGYFGSDYVYIKLYNILRSANDSYKITINQESGRLLISLLRTCLNTLSLCIELRAHVAAASSPATPTHSGSGGGSNSADAAFPSSAVLKLIEEILQYLTKLVNYAPGECIACLRQLLKYLFGQNYGNRQRDYYATFVSPYFAARRRAQQHNTGEGEGSGSVGDSVVSGRSVPETMSPPPVAINSSVTTSSGSAQPPTATRTRPATASKAAAALATATARVTATATALGAATATVMGMTAATAAPTPTTAATMTSSTVAHNERSVIGTRPSYGGASADAGGSHTSSDAAEYYRLQGELFASGLRVSACKSERESECAKHIKLFEPLVIHSLMLFLKSNAKVQAPILELLSQLLDLNVTYSVLDSKNVIFDQIINNLDLIENGIARNGHLIIPSMIKFLVQLTHKSDRKLITIPKIISITNNLLANNAVRDCAVLALKALSYEVFFMAPAGDSAALSTLADYRAPFQSPVTRSPLATPMQQRRPAAEEAAAAAAAAEALLASSRELDTQKEVVLGMLEKFLDASQSQLVIGLLLLRERSAQQLDATTAETHAAATGGERVDAGYTLESTLLKDPSVVYAMICRAMCEGRLSVKNWNDFYLLETCFKNYDKFVLAHSKEFLALLQLFITKDVTNFCDLSHATIILANVILKTEEIYLVNHIKLYLKNHPAVEERALQLQRQQQQGAAHWLLDGPSTSAAAAALSAAMATLPAASSTGLSEINYFARVLCEKLEACFVCLQAADSGPADVAYCRLVARFVKALHAVCCRSRHKDALQSVFRLVLAESDFLDKYYSFAAAATPTPVDSCTNDANLGAPCTRLQLQVFKLLSAMKLLDAVVLLQLQRQRQQQIQATQAGGIKWHNEQRTLLREICQQNPNAKEWTAQQVQQLLDAGAARSGDAAFLNFLIADNFAFVGNLCEVDAGLGSLWQRALLQHADALNKHSIRALGPLLLRQCSANNCSAECAANWLQLLLLLHDRHAGDRALQARLERLVRRLVAACPQEKEALRRQLEAAGGNSTLACKVLKDFPDNQQTAVSADSTRPEEQQQQRIIDEKWLLAQLIKFSTQRDYQEPQQLARILLEIQSEHKLHKIFSSGAFDVPRVLRHAIAGSLLAMLAAFRSNCVQHNPHIHYMQPNPLVRVSGAVLMARIGALVASAQPTAPATCGPGVVAAPVGSDDDLYLCGAVIALIECIGKIEATALVYIESRFIDKFVREHLLRPEHIATLLSFLDWCCRRAERLLHAPSLQQRQVAGSVGTLLRCVEVLLQQRFVWLELNQPDGKLTSATPAAGGLTLLRRNVLLCRVLDVLVLAARRSLQNTIFYKRCQALQASVFGAAGAEQQTSLEKTLAQLKRERDREATDDDVAALLVHVYAPKAVFLARLIEARVDVGAVATGACLSTAYIAGAGAGSACGSTAGIGGGAAGGAVGGGGGAGAGAAANGVAGDFEGGCDDAQIPMHFFESIGIALLRTNQFYAYAVTPFEIIQQQQREQQLRLGAYESPVKRVATAAAATATAITSTTTSTPTPASTPSGKLPTIPVESLSDVDVLRKFVKRLSIFGFTTRQQFEEYFMTFLLLINKVYDENMVDEQEQFQIKSTCLEAILELLITYKSFPIVGNKLSHFHHTTRWSRINCDSISLKKLHKVHLLVAESNVFYQPNLERDLGAAADGAARDNIIGTGQFGVNQYDLNFVWQQMEVYAQLTADATTSEASSAETSAAASAATDKTTKEGAARHEDTASRNYRYFTTQSGVDFKSSAQLIFDVLMQIIEHNHVLVLPNLVKFCEICESREQIKWIRDKALKLQESIPMDDTISHQHLIYLLCKTQAMLIPTLGELQQLCTLIGNYLKSSHIFIRNATLAGVLCLLECCSKTNTSIGKLSEELSLLRELIVGYINRHGIIDAGAMQCSDTHTKLVWTLNYCLIEWTSKFVPQCHLLSNTVIAAGNLLRRTSNEDVYLCVLHGLERVVVIGNSGSGSTGSGNVIGSSPGGGNVGGAADADGGGGIVSPLQRHKIEKLALELVKLENEKFSIPALQLLLTCTYMGSAKQLESTELSNGIVQDDPEIIAQQTDKVDILLHCIKSSTREAAWIYGRVLCQIIRDLVPPNEILTKVIKEFLAVNQPHCDVIAMIVYQVFRCAIDSSFLQVLQDWLICSLPTFLALPERKGVWCLSVIFLSASINLHLIKLFPVVLGARAARKLGQHEIALFVTAAQDFHAKLSAEQRLRFRDAFEKFPQNQVYAQMLHGLW